MTDLLPMEIWNEVRSHLETGLDQAAFRVVCRAFAQSDPGPAAKGGVIERKFWKASKARSRSMVFSLYTTSARFRLAVLAAELDVLIPSEALFNATCIFSEVGGEGIEKRGLGLQVVLNDGKGCLIEWCLDILSHTVTWFVYDDLQERANWTTFAEARTHALALVTKMLAPPPSQQTTYSDSSDCEWDLFG
jgi:hypothetical protein